MREQNKQLPVPFVIGAAGVRQSVSLRNTSLYLKDDPSDDLLRENLRLS